MGSEESGCVKLTYNVKRESHIPAEILAEDPLHLDSDVLAERAEDSFWSHVWEHLDNDPVPAKDDIDVVHVDVPTSETRADTLVRGIGFAAGRKASIMAIEEAIEDHGLTRLERYELALSILNGLNREAPLAWSKESSRGETDAE